VPAISVSLYAGNGVESICREREVEEGEESAGQRGENVGGTRGNNGTGTNEPLFYILTLIGSLTLTNHIKTCHLVPF